MFCRYFSPTMLSPKISFSSTAQFSSSSLPSPDNRHVWNLFISLPLLWVIVNYFVKLIPFAKQGFFCHDIDILHPYREDTLPAESLYNIFIGLSVVLVVATECSLVRHLTRRGGRPLQRPNGLHPLVVNCAYFLVALYSAGLVIIILYTTGKRVCSRLRPNFISACRPRNLSALCPPNTVRYIADYECTGPLFDEEAYQSFPSGHAAQACNTTVLIVHYLQKRFKLAPSLRSFAQFFMVLFTYLICLSRVRDNKHRFSDVAAGALLGAGAGLFFIKYVLHNFRPNRYQLAEEEDCAQNMDEFPVSPMESARKLGCPQLLGCDGERASFYGSIDDAASIGSVACLAAEVDRTETGQ